MLIDTNVLIYAYDPRDGRKQQRAGLVVDALIDSSRAVLSAQCLSEFFNASTRLPEPLSREDARVEVVRFSSSCSVFPLTADAVVEGARVAVRYQLSIWDALIWSVASLNGVTHVLTEDAEHGRVIEGVEYVDPFSPAFDPGALGLSLRPG
jgi:predicted nucleic acid-binding protein